MAWMAGSCGDALDDGGGSGRWAPRDAVGNRMGRGEPVFVESVTQPRTGEPRMAVALQLAERLLRAQRLSVEKRMRIFEFVQHQ